MAKTKKKLDLSGDDPLDQDLSDFINDGGWQRVRFIMAPKDTTVTMRLPQAMVQAVKDVAAREGVRYQGLVRQFIAEGLVKHTPKGAGRA